MKKKPTYISATGGTETIIHDKCGTPDCCGNCASADIPVVKSKQVQLDLFPKDTKEKPLSFDGGAKSTLSYMKREWPSLKKKLGIT